jgi:hypothetical protein
MPAPYNERQALERERGELPGQLATYQGDLDATAPGHKARREGWRGRFGGFRSGWLKLRRGWLEARCLPHPTTHNRGAHGLSLLAQTA